MRRKATNGYEMHEREGYELGLPCTVGVSAALLSWPPVPTIFSFVSASHHSCCCLILAVWHRRRAIILHPRQVCGAPGVTCGGTPLCIADNVAIARAVMRPGKDLHTSCVHRPSLQLHIPSLQLRSLLKDGVKHHRCGHDQGHDAPQGAAVPRLGLTLPAPLTAAVALQLRTKDVEECAGGTDLE